MGETGTRTLVSIAIPVYNGECYLRDAIIELTFKRYDSSVILPKYINAFFK